MKTVNYETIAGKNVSLSVAKQLSESAFTATNGRNYQIFAQRISIQTKSGGIRFVGHINTINEK